MEDLHDATESLTGEEEHFWLLHAAMNGSYYHAEEELRWRIPNIDDGRRDDYIDALKAVIERGWMAYDINCHLYSVDVLPRELIDYAKACYDSHPVPDAKDKTARGTVTALANAIVKACFVSGRYEEAYEYAMKGGSDCICPLVYTMLLDGSGVKSNEDLAKELVSRFYPTIPISEGLDVIGWLRCVTGYKLTDRNDRGCTHTTV